MILAIDRALRDPAQPLRAQRDRAIATRTSRAVRHARALRAIALRAIALRARTSA